MPVNERQQMDDFYSTPGRSTAFVPAAARGGAVDNRQKNRRRSSAPALLKLLAAVAVIAAVGHWGVPPAWSAIQDAENRTLTSDLGAIAQAEIAYHRQNGSFTDSLTEIAGETSVNQVQVITADATHLCLKATPLLHQADLYYTPRTGITTASCE